MNTPLFFLVILLFGSIDALERITLMRKPVPKNKEILKNLINYARSNNTNQQLKVAIDLYNFQDVQYYGTVKVGSGKKEFQVLFDTGSDIFWIPGIDIDASGTCAVNHNKFDCSKSSTCVALKQDGAIDYLKGETRYHLANDTVTIGDVSVKRQQIGLVYEGDCEGSQFDGIMGMSLQMRDGYPPVFQGMIEQHLVSYPVFSFFLNKEENGRPGGELYFGGWDPKYKETDFNYIPLVPGQGFWQVAMDSVYFGSDVITGRGHAIFDTGTSLIITSQAAANKIARKLGGFLMGDIVMIECSKMDNVPQLIFSIYGEDYFLSAQELLYGESDGLCLLGVGGNDQLQDNEWLLGDTFLSRFYSVHDYQNKRIALIRLNGTTPTSIPPHHPTTTEHDGRSDVTKGTLPKSTITPPNYTQKYPDNTHPSASNASSITYSICTIFALSFLVMFLYHFNF